METIHINNVNHLLPRGIMLIRDKGVFQESRYGNTLEVPGPVATCYQYPWERVLFHPDRDANPFFHLFESLWILGGRHDVAFLTQFNKRMAEFSDDGATFHAPYGYRLRAALGQDQISDVISLFKRDPTTRRAVLQIWDARLDLNTQSKDIPCNDLIFLKIRNNRLHISVANRSNDFIWGQAGANCVQFSMLQEYIANKLSVGIGEYHQVADSFHIYLDNPLWKKLEGMSVVPDDPYAYDQVNGPVIPSGLGANDPYWDQDNHAFLDDPFGDTLYQTAFFDKIVQPMALAWMYHKAGETVNAQLCLDGKHDWHVAADQWLARRIK